ncbi:membrane dipeptidase [Massilia sp. CFBP9012]|uniref:dipeptidase n=1 Tax=Massilia sp. CFBP9012 TaxID=3096531 RepID=UPI002A6B6069|nr:membrane dipeptidase [Massilia sp. CFBP9012]MDY0977527.1 membrane dipeptidase [Massilia sp. CFBP9012]
MKKTTTASLTLASLFALAGCAAPGGAPQIDETHRRLLTLDAHLDTPVHFGRAGWDFGARHDPAVEVAQVDLGRMREGSLDGGFFAIFTDQGPLTPEGYAAARAHALARSQQIDTTLARHADRIGVATTAAEARRLDAAGKLVAFKSIENSYPLGDGAAAMTALAHFQRQGVRLAGIVHSKNNQFADSSTDKPTWNGLSPLGRDWVREMNRLGMVIDASHASDATVDQMLALSASPLLLSHSSSRTSYDHPRNIDDARIRRIAAGGGAICASTIYLSELKMGPQRAALFDRLEHIGTLAPAGQAALSRKWLALDAVEPLWQTSFEQYIASLKHLIAVAGIDHVCMGADFDGGGGLAGLDNVAHLPRITERLKADGMTNADLAKLWSGNLLRVLEAAENGASL